MTSSTERKHGCCSGIAYMSKTMDRNGKSPICVGVKQQVEGLSGHLDVRQLPDNHTNYQYYCIGFSVYPDGETKDGQPQLPYCEGLEVAIVEESLKQQNTAAQPSLSATPSTDQPQTVAPLTNTLNSQSVASSASSHQPQHGNDTDKQQKQAADEHLNSLHTRFMNRLHKNADKIMSVLSGQSSIHPILKSPPPVEELPAKLSETAARNVQRMKTAANLIAGNINNRIYKPLSDLVSGAAGSDGRGIDRWTVREK